MINLVQIYALPAKATERLTSSDEKKFLAMFHRYCDGLPVCAPSRPHPPSTHCAPEVSVWVEPEPFERCDGGALVCASGGSIKSVCAHF